MISKRYLLSRSLLGEHPTGVVRAIDFSGCSDSTGVIANLTVCCLTFVAVISFYLVSLFHFERDICKRDNRVLLQIGTKYAGVCKIEKKCRFLPAFSTPPGISASSSAGSALVQPSDSYRSA